MKDMRTAVALVVIVILAAVTYYRSLSHSEPTPSASSPMSQRIELKTSDSVTIVGDYYAPMNFSVRGLVLLHMMPADRASWREFADKMQQAEWHVLAIDLRGHGESQGGPRGYRNFSDTEHQASTLDVEAGAEFLKSHGVTQISLGGASIGANLALRFLAENSEAKSAFLLSPGLDYRGVKTEPAAQLLQPEQAVYIVASSEDMRSSGQSAIDMADILFRLCPCKKEIEKLDGAGHGTTMFERDPALMDRIAAWLSP